MVVVREVLYCRPGKVKPVVQMFKKMNDIGVPMGWPKMRIMTDVAGEQYWTCVVEVDVENYAAFEKMMSMEGMKEADMKQMDEIMKGYHDLVDHGKREIFKLES